MSLRTLGGQILIGPSGPIDCDSPCCTGGSGPPGPCNYVVDCSPLTVLATGGSIIPVPLSVGIACPWHVETADAWINLTPPTSHLSAGNIALSGEANPSMCDARSGTISVIKTSSGPGDPICSIIVNQSANRNAIAKMMRIIVERTARAGGAAPAIAWPTRMYQPGAVPVLWPVPQQAVPTVPLGNFYSAAGVVEYPDDEFYEGDFEWRDIQNGDPAGTFAALLVNAVRAVMDTGSSVSPVNLYFADILGLDFRLYDNVTGVGTLTVYNGGSLPAVATPSTYCDRYNEFLAALPKLLGAATAINSPASPATNAKLANIGGSGILNGFNQAKACLPGSYGSLTRGDPRTFFGSNPCSTGGTDGFAVNQSGMTLLSNSVGPGGVDCAIEAYASSKNYSFADINFIGVSNREMYGKIGFGGASYRPPAIYGSPANGFYALVSSGLSVFTLSESDMDSESAFMFGSLTDDKLGGLTYQWGWLISSMYGVVYFTFTESF